ncbi:MAG: hypothetical protein ACR2OI_12345 [Acidimicrobiia bacterium]
MRKIATVGMALALFLGSAAPALAGGPPPRNDDGDRVRVTVYVESQHLWFDSIVGPSLPMKGKFQELKPQADGSLKTLYGPGDPGYRGGRWWIDMDNSGTMNEGDAFFSCPLLGHGSASPA